MSNIEVGDLLYDYTVKITGVTEFGFSLESLAAGEAAPPPEGARFDVHFEGPVSGSKIKGNVKGIDHLNVRADGRIDLDIRGVITTEDGQSIALAANGVCILSPGNPVAELRENVRLHTSSPQYGWVNGIQVWGIGTVDLAEQLVRIKGYQA